MQPGQVCRQYGSCELREFSPRNSKDGLEAIQNLVGPEALETVQRLVQRDELVGVDAADLLHRAHVLLIELLDDVAHVTAFVGQLDAHRAAINAAALMVEKAEL